MYNWSHMVRNNVSRHLQETVDGGGRGIPPGELVHDQRQDGVRVSRASALHRRHQYLKNLGMGKGS